MILRLALAQARSQRAYIGWTAALMTLTIGLSVVAMSLAATQQRLNDQSDVVWARDGEHRATLAPYPLDGQPSRVPPPGDAEFSALLEEALADGDHVTAMRIAHSPLLTNTAQSLPRDYYGGMLVAVEGDYPWELLLIEGEPPGEGEIVLNASWAERRGLAIGDPVPIYVPVYPDLSVSRFWGIVTVSGLSRTGFTGAGMWVETPGAFLPWSASEDPTGPFTAEIWNRGEPTRDGFFTQVTWSGDSRTLASMEGLRSFVLTGGWASIEGVAWAGTIAAVLAVSIIVMAFAVGRAQAQGRLQWTATARTLGATRGSLAWATVTESVLLACLAVGLGVPAGLLAADEYIARVNVDPVLSLGPTSAASAWWVGASALGFALVLAIVIAAVPAFWGSRVAPVAALKPVTPLNEAEASRRVSPWWFIGIAAASIPGLVPRGPNSVWDGIWVFLSSCALALSGFVLLKELLRWLVGALGRKLSERRAGWAIASGDALRSRPRQGSASALLQAIAVGLASVMVTFQTLDALQVDAWHRLDHNPSESAYGSAFAGIQRQQAIMLALILVAVQLISLAITFSGRRAGTADSATRRALGLTAGQNRVASAVEHGAPQVVGIGVGAAIGFLVITPLYFSTGLSGHVLWAGHVEAIGIIVVTAFVVAVLAAVACAFVAAGAAVVWAANRAHSPMGTLRSVGRS